MNTYKVINIVFKSDDTFLLRVERPMVPIKAGQCFNLGVPGMGINREYSMYSGANDDFLDFLIRKIDGGFVSSKLGMLRSGDSIEIDGPYGEFCIKEGNITLPHIFLASGTGIAPFHSFIKTYQNLDYKLLHGVRFNNETYDSNDYDDGKYIPCISKNRSGKSSRVTDYLSDNKIDPRSIIYLCGNRHMITDSLDLIYSAGIGGDQVITEVFF